jgi:hypothetical protein
MGKEHRRGTSPPPGNWGHDEVGEGAGTRGKATKHGYARSTHMKGDVGPTSKADGGRTPKRLVHTGYHNTGEEKEHGSSMKLPMEKNVPFRKGIDPGDHFEAEIKEHFPSKKGVAGINATGMDHKNSPVESESVSHSHGKVSGKAEHLPSMKEAHNFKSPMMGTAHSFGHDHEQRSGFLRLSGHRSAHRIGARKGK